MKWVALLLVVGCGGGVEPATTDGGSVRVVSCVTPSATVRCTDVDFLTSDGAGCRVSGCVAGDWCAIHTSAWDVAGACE